MDSSSLPSFRALVLEDHDFQRKISAQVLSQCGAGAVLEAADGESALSVLRSTDASIDVMLCDLQMPGMDGLEFLRHAAKLGCSASLILASALEPSIIRAAEIMAKSYGLRIIGTVDKPISRIKLMPLLLRHFGWRHTKPGAAIELMPAAEIAAGIEDRQFVPFFQPKVDVRTGALVGAEALMRWRHPDRGWIAPAAFIPVMESNGLIDDATFGLVGASLAQCRAWQDQGLDIPVAVNISVESLRNTDLPDRLEGLTAAAGLKPAAMTIEVTETVAMTDIGPSLETLARSRMKGFNISIDDYGTGFSSLQQLTRLPVSELKIDQAFITGAASEPVLQALIETSVAMAKRLDLRTVAEGIETSDDWDTIARLGCEMAQGYFIAKPMEGTHLVEWYRNWLSGRRAVHVAD